MIKSATRRLNQALIVVISLLFFISLCTYLAFENKTKSREDVANSRAVISVVNRVFLDFKNAEMSQASFSSSHDDRYLNIYNENIKEISKSLNETRSYLVDDELQSNRLDSIESVFNERKSILAQLINETVANKDVDSFVNAKNKANLDSFSGQLDQFIDHETIQLEKRIKQFDTDSFIAIVVVVFGVLLSILIVLYLYNQLKKEILERDGLQQLLKHKDELITNRIQSTQALAHKIANGNYSVRVTDESEDELGSLTLALNEMASSLETAFGNINDNNWKQSGIAKLNKVLNGNKTQEDITIFSITHLIESCNCINGAFYVFDSGVLKLQASYGFESYMKDSFNVGEGVIGQTYLDHKLRNLDYLGKPVYVANCANGGISVSHIVVLPLITDNECVGVIELGSVEAFSALDIDFLEQSSVIIALELVSAISRMHVQVLLEETQTQSEELRSQHTELETLNTILENHAQQLQASEEELRVQQEELMQTNQQLEEKNEIVAFRNLEIQKKAEELAISTKYKSEFLANMSHELRTPLNSILLLSRLMSENLEENLSNDQVESVKVIESSGTSLLNLIDEILDLSKIEAGKMELEYASVSIESILRDVEGMFKPIVREKGLDFVVNVAEGTPKNIEIDKLRLEQVLRNLLSNAIKFTSKGSVKLKIFLDNRNSELLHFVVEDSGIGIDKENQKLIFEAFHQADGSTRRKFGGTGLGLSISREIAKLFGGELQVESELNVGSTFSLIVPITKEERDLSLAIDILDNTTDIEIIRQERELRPAVVLELPEEIPDDRFDISVDDKVILIVEDDTSFAKALLSVIKNNGYKGVVIVRGDHVLDAVEKYNPLAILLDIQLPKMDGWQVIDALKANKKMRHIPVHIMSASEAKRESLLHGAIDFINKPMALDKLGEMFEKIDQVLAGGDKKVLIVEEDPKHAAALADFLSNYDISTEIRDSAEGSVSALLSTEVNCVILDMRIGDTKGYETLEAIKTTKGLEYLPIIIFTGRNLSNSDELRIKQYADSIVVKTAHSFQRILDEVGLFLHIIEENKKSGIVGTTGYLKEVLNDKTVLLVDDDMRNIFSLTKILEHYKMNVIAAIDGKDALEKLEQNSNISIVLMDMMMPEMDGYESVEKIRTISKYKKLPIIAVTAKAMAGDREKCIEAGASDYISKPVDKDQLISLLRVWLYE